jgi:hypothetical protein
MQSVCCFAWTDQTQRWLITVENICGILHVLCLTNDISANSITQYRKAQGTLERILCGTIRKIQGRWGLLNRWRPKLSNEPSFSHVPMEYPIWYTPKNSHATDALTNGVNKPKSWTSANGSVKSHSVNDLSECRA